MGEGEAERFVRGGDWEIGGGGKFPCREGEAPPGFLFPFFFFYRGVVVAYFSGPLGGEPSRLWFWVGRTQRGVGRAGLAGC